MFGIIRPCRHRLSERLRTSWWAHLCGLCLTLRDDHGQFARAATNYDGLIISALVEAQSPAGSPRRVAGPCPLRGMRTAPVSVGEGARLAAAASLVLASAKVRDHVDDRDGVFGRRPVAGAARVVADRWARQGGVSAHSVGFDTTPLVDAVGRQASVESSVGPGDSVLVVTEPTESATSAACAHTAVLAGRPGNVEPLGEVGRLFGRVVHLVDAVEDLAEDTGTGAWNPLTATGTTLTEARRLCDDAVLGVRLALRECVFTDAALVHALLVHELEQAVVRAFAHAGSRKRGRSAGREVRDGDGGCLWLPRFRIPARERNAAAGCGIAMWQCCTCQFCCRDPFPGPWSGRPRESCGDCCECCDCCDC
ncbi:DUF5685 family protein [Actinophytocola gossypii]|uniref:Regulatory protein n=1 Tax=Actinophytocola gossypii TaxID=2812003 RepID=A0ABT2JGW6_9PSEU|nr:DUF5685 family protein [Actinophytocola gossypii]MCT2587114.1 hypothetical protein [Actinophytocola gossypii]